jgi:hypothetical protein
VDRAAIDPQTRAIHAVTAQSHDKTIDCLKNLFGQIEHNSHPRCSETIIPNAGLCRKQFKKQSRK